MARDGKVWRLLCVCLTGFQPLEGGRAMRLNSWRRVTRFGWGACAAVGWVTFAGAAPAYSAWSLVPSASPGGSAPQLLAVSTESASDAWGVGVTFSTSTRRYQTVNEHWNANAGAVAARPTTMTNQPL